MQKKFKNPFKKNSPKMIEPQILPAFLCIVDPIKYLQETRKQNTGKKNTLKYQILESLEKYITLFSNTQEETIEIIDTKEFEAKQDIYYDSKLNCWKIDKNMPLFPIKIKLKKYQKTRTIYHLHFPTLTSTNSFLKKHSSFFPSHTLIDCDIQTQGRGRMNRIWQSDDYKNLTMSLLLKKTKNEPWKSSEKLASLSLVVGASMAKTMDELLQNEVSTIKWPNDILIHHKKICGILLEGVSSNELDTIIIGIGLNVNTTLFPNELQNKAISLKQILNKELDPSTIIPLFLHWFYFLYDDFLSGNEKYLEICKEKNDLKGKKVYIENIEALVLDITPQGNLLIQTNETTQEVFFGEVTLEQVYEQQRIAKKEKK